MTGESILLNHIFHFGRQELKHSRLPDGTLVEFDKSLDVAMAKLRRALHLRGIGKRIAPGHCIVRLDLSLEHEWEHH